MNPLEAVIFDFGGVVSQPMGPVLAGIEGEFGIAPGTLLQLFYGGELWKAAEVGAMSYADYVAACREGIRSHVGSTEVAARVWDRWYGSFYQPTFMPGVLDIVHALQGQVRVAMLSNASPGMEERLRDQFRVAHLFDPLISSAAIGVAKPDARAFEITLERVGLQAEQCFFVDDTEVNVSAASRLGIRAHLFQDAGALRAALEGEGLRLATAQP
jgi:putative hydrolase of the HAD superfamily